MSLKRVRIDGGVLHVCNFRHEVLVPLQQIDAVAFHRSKNAPRIVVALCTTTQYCRQIRSLAIGMDWRRRPTVTELGVLARFKAWDEHGPVAIVLPVHLCIN